MYVGDSRSRYGPGFLPLQHHEFVEKGFELDLRASVCALRIVDRLDEFGHWVYEDELTGDLVGALVWEPETREIPAWSWLFPIQIGRVFAATSPNEVIYEAPRGEEPTPYREPAISPTNEISSGGGGGSEPWGLTFTHLVYVNGKATLQTGPSTGGAPGVALKLAEPKKVPWFGLAGGPLLSPWAGAGTVGLSDSIKAPNFFGLEGEFLNAIFGSDPYNSSAVFGLAVDPYGIGIPGHGDIAIKPDATQEEKEENATKAYFSGDAVESKSPEPSWPIRSSFFDRDVRFEAKIFDPIPGHPETPTGAVGLVVAGTEENEQSEIFLPTDPRLVAVHVGRYPKTGSIVCDTDARGGYSTTYAARLQSLCRIALHPRGKIGILKANADAAEPANFLAWNIGPNGRGDGGGGLVVDRSWATSKGDAPVIFAAVAVREGGPFDVGWRGDKHQIGTTGDGIPINVLHFSTKANWIRRGSVLEDGPMRFEYVFKEGGDLDIVTRVHFAFDHKRGDWGWWSTAPEYRPATKTPSPEPTPTPTPPTGPPTTTPTPGEPGGPTGGPGGRVVDPSGRGDNDIPNPVDRGPETLEIPKHESARRDPNWPEGEEPLPPAPPYEGPRLILPSSDPKILRSITTRFREAQFTSVSFRAPTYKPGLIDVRNETPESIAAFDEGSPTVLRVDTYGEQGGVKGGPYFSGGVGSARVEGSDPKKTQEAGESRYAGGTGSGGIVFMPPENDLDQSDDDFDPGNLDAVSESFVVAAPGVRFAAGLPELASGGVRDGFSFGVDGAVLKFYQHDGAGDVAKETSFLDVAEVKTKSGSDFGIGAGAGNLEDVSDTTKQKQIGIRTDSGNEKLSVNIGGVIFSAALT